MHKTSIAGTVLALATIIYAQQSALQKGILPWYYFRQLCQQLNDYCLSSCTMFYVSKDQCIRQCVQENQGYCEEFEADTKSDLSVTHAPSIYLRTENLTNTNKARNKTEPLWKAPSPTKSEDGYDVWEGDMILNPDQVELLWGRGRKAEAREAYLWPGGIIPFSISQSSSSDRKMIMEAINHWMSHTCLKFHEVPANSIGPHLIFVKKRGCSASVGRQFKQFPNGQPLSVGDGCEEMGLIAHEIGHAIGFFHEHTRADRDQVVKVMYDNIDTRLQRNFNLAKHINNYDVPYDIHSIMHYTSKAFTANGKNTIVTIDPRKQLAIGQRHRLSYNDVRLANAMYCSKKSPRCQISCLNQGVVDYFCKCVCPPDFEGSRCERPIIPKCGGNVTVEKIITTLNYPKKYSQYTQCTWWIYAPPNKRIKLKFLDFDLMSRAEQNGKCEWDNVEIRTTDLYEGEVSCGTEMKGRSITSSGNQMLVFFSTEYSFNRGFKAAITFENLPNYF